MKIVTTFHKPSSVLASLKCRLSSTNVEHLVVAKLNRIQVHSIQPSGAQLECSLEVHGKVTAVKAIPIPKSTRSNLVVMLAHPDPELIFLSYAESEDGTAELQPTKQVSLYERTPRPAEFFNDILVHPSGKLAVASCYVGKLKIINLKAGRYQDDFDASLPELNVLSLSFLPLPEDEYALAIIHFDHQQRIQLLARDVEVEDLQLSTVPSTHLHSTLISDKLFPYPADSPPKLVPANPHSGGESGSSLGQFRGGVLVVGGRKILLYELVDKEGQDKQRGKRRRLEDKKSSKDPVENAKAREKETEREGRRRKPRASVSWPWSDIAAWCSADDGRLRFVLGDSYGKLALLSLDSLQDLGLVLVPLGEVSPPTTLTYLTNQILYVGSHMGDSQLVQLTTTPSGSIDQPTLPIPSDIHTIPPSSLDVSTFKKGKGRAISPDFDSMEVDNDAETPQESGNVVATKGSYLNSLEQFKNIAPIVDACLVDIDGGQRQIVTCSGGRSAGSINIVRNGADFQEVVNIPGVPHVLGVWAVKSKLEDGTDSFLLVSFYGSTRLIRIDDDGGGLSLSPLDNTTTIGLVTSEPTIAFANVAQRVRGQDGKARYTNSSLVVQVTRGGVGLLELDEGLQTYSRVNFWDITNVQSDPPAEVVAASINSSQVALAISGGKLALLSVAEDRTLRLSVSMLKPYKQPEISAVSCTPLNPTRAFSQNIVVSYWESNTIEIFTVVETGFKSVFKSPPLPSLVTSLLFYNFGSDNSPKGPDHHPYLLAGLSDGSAAVFVYHEQQLKDRKIVSLGHAPIRLIPCVVDGARTVLAVGNRAIVFAFERNRLVHSPIVLKNIVAASSLTTPSLPTSLIIASADGLHIGTIKDLNKLHIRSIPFGLDNPRRLAYQPLLSAFGVAFLRTEPARIGDVETLSSSFKLIDGSSFEVLAQFNCDSDEEVTSVIPISATVDDVLTPFFIAGTFIYHPEETEPEKGRLLLISVSTNNSRSTKQAHQLFVAASIEVKGCVYALKPVTTSKGESRIVAAVNSSIMLFKLDIDTEVFPSGLELRKVAEWNHNYLVTSLGSSGDHVFAGDQISSVSLLKVGGDKFQTVARDYGPRWPVAVEAIDEKNVIGANDALNLFTFTLSRNLGRNVLDCNGGYHIADLVNKIIQGSLATTDQSEETALQPEEIFFTSSGRIGVIVDVKQNDVSLHLTELQRNLAAVVPSVGGTSHARFRAPKSTRGRSDADQASFGFLDGDFIEQILLHMESPDVLAKIWQGQSEPEKLSISVDQARRLLEDLQSYHR